MTPYLNTPAPTKMKEAIENLKRLVAVRKELVTKAKKFHEK